MSFLDTLAQEINSITRKFPLTEAKAFPVLVARIVLDLDDMDAYDAITVEGPNEKGMDIFWIDQQQKRVFIAQCKYSKTGTSNPGVKDVRNLLNCTNWLSNPQTLEREGRLELLAAATEYKTAVEEGYKIELWFVYAGSRNENIDKEIRVYNANPENRMRNRSAIHCDLDLLETLFEEFRGLERRIERAIVKIQEQPVELEGTFGKGLLTSIAAPDLISLYNEFGDKLFARNVRMWLGARRGSVNAGIIATVEDERERGNFWAYNNGITVVCDHYAFDENTQELTLNNFSIVNGCQTTVSLALADAEDSERREVRLLARFISPPASIIDSIIKFTNTQNPIRSWDLVSQDPTQIRLKRDFEGLNRPSYYAIRRGEWTALSGNERRKFRHEEGPGWRTIKHDLLAQYLASFKARAVVAYKNKAFLFDRYYSETFPPDLRAEEALFVWQAGEITQEVVREEIRKEAEKVAAGDETREKYQLMLKRGGRFYVLGVLGLLAELQNGPDYLRSITEERITSKRAYGRILKYAELSTVWYKQVVAEMLESTGSDLSVLIREQDFFERVTEKVINLYEAFSVNKEWIEGALPRLQ